VSAHLVREFGPHPLTIIREAIEHARVIGVAVRIGDRGVECVSTHGPVRWRRVPTSDGVDPIGAAILHRQPAPADIDEAAAIAVNAPLAWVEGCSDGMKRTEPSQAWTVSIKRRLYGAGYDVGTWLRVQLLHNLRRTPAGGKV